MEIVFLGTSAGMPTKNRNVSGLAIRRANSKQWCLVDCGEGTQMQIRKYKLKFQRINHIFISHLHGDHYLGLMGLLSTMHLLGRKREIHIYSPPGLKEILKE